MPQTLDKLVVRFESKNAEKVKSELKKLGVEFEKVSTKGKKGFNRLRVETEGLRRNVGLIRNNLLLVTFATEAARRAFSGFMKAAGKIEQFEARLRSMSRSAEVATRQIKLFMKIAAETPFTVESIVQGGVQLQAFGANAEALMKPMANLAAFMGRTVPEAANAFGRAFAGGRGAADVFRETGILTIIDDFESLDESLNKTGLNLAEFRVKMVEALGDPDGKIANGIKELEGTLFQTFSNMQDAVFVFQSKVGKELAPVFIELAKNVTEFLNALDTKDIRRFISVIKVLIAAILGKLLDVLLAQVGALAAVSLSYIKAGRAAGSYGFALVGLNKKLAKNWVMLVAIAAVSFVEWTDNTKTAIEDLEDKVKSGTITFEEYLEQLREAMALEAAKERDIEAAKNIIALEQRLAILMATNEIEKEQAKHARKLTWQEIQILKKIDAQNKLLKEQEELRQNLLQFNKEFAKEERDHYIRNVGDINAKKRLEKLAADEKLTDQLMLSEMLVAMSEAEQEKLTIGYREADLIRSANAVKDLELRRKKLANITLFFDDLRRRNEEELQQELQDIRDTYSEEELDKLAEDLQARMEFNETLKQNYFDMYSEINSEFKAMIESQLREELNQLRKSDKYRNSSMEKRQDMERDLEESYKAQRMMSFRIEQILQIKQLIMKLAETKATIDLLAIAATSAGDATAKARAEAFKKQATMSVGIQSAMIAAQKPAFATGGSFITDGPQQIIVGDNPGGRERVDIVPISSPNIDGPQGASISINIMGHVIGTEEFVRDTLLPEIDNTIKRNLA